MRSKLTPLVGGLAGAAVIVPAVALGAPTAQAAPLHPAASTVHPAASLIHPAASAVHPAVSVVPSVRSRPAYAANVTLTVRCGKFTGQILHGGVGGLADPAYLEVKGKLSSSCHSTTYLQMRWNVGFTGHSGIIGKAAARRTANVDWQIKSRNGTYAHIGGRVGTIDGTPRGRVLWGGWRNV